MRNKIFLLIPFLLLGLVFLSSPLKRIFTSSVPSSSTVRSEQEVLTKPELVRVTESNGYFDLAWLDNRRVIAVGYDGHNPNRLYLSKDGSAWTFKIMSAEDSIMYAVSFVHDNGWIVGSSGLVLFTSDGGDTFERLRKPTYHELSKVKFISEKVGYTSSRVERGGEIFRTTDGGRDWSRVYEDLDAGYIFDLTAFGENIAIAAINNSYLIRTEDGGQKWKVVDSKVEGAASVAFIPDGTAWLVGRKGSFYVSIDKGKTWHRPLDLPVSLLNHDWHSIAFADAKLGIAVGEKGAMAVTYDGGANWLEVETNTEDRLKAIQFNGQRALILGSENIYQVVFPST